MLKLKTSKVQYTKLFKPEKVYIEMLIFSLTIEATGRDVDIN